MSEFVLDASAVLALLQREKGHEEVVAVVGEAKVSAVNLAEVGSQLADKGRPMTQVRATLDGLGLDIVPFDEEQAFEVARLRPLTRSLGLSLGDRACLALAVLRGVPAMTADRTWSALRLGIDVRVIR